MCCDSIMYSMFDACFLAFYCLMQHHAVETLNLKGV